MTNIDNNSTSLSDHDIRLYLEDLSLRSWYNRKPVAIYLCTLVVVGSLGNTWCFLVYFFCFSVNSTRVLVLAMSLCDLVTNLIGLPLQIYTIRHAYDSFDVPLCRSMFVFATIPTQLSGFLILLVAYDRYRYICRPFCVKRDTTKAMTQVVIAVIVTCVIFLPFAWLYGYHTVDSPLPGVKAVMCWIHDDYRNGPYIRAYLIVLSTVFFVGLFILTILYSLIGETIFRHRFSMSVRLRSVTVVYPHPSKGENLLTHLSKRFSLRAKPGDLSGSVHSKDTVEDTSKPHFQSSTASTIKKETWEYNPEDSTEGIINRKVTEGAISVITENKRLSEFMGSYVSTSESSEEETVTVEPGGNQAGPSEVNERRYTTTSRIVRISTLTGEDISKPGVVSSSASNTHKETTARNIKDSTDLPQREKRERKVTPGGTPVKKRNKKLRELTEIYESAWEPSEKETVTVEPEENQVGPSKKVSEKRHRSPRTVRISTQTDEDTSKPEFVSSSASHVKKIPLKRDSKKFAELLKIYEGAFQQSEPDRSRAESSLKQESVSDANSKASSCPTIFRVSKVHHSKTIQIQTTIMMAALTALYIVNWLPHLLAR